MLASFFSTRVLGHYALSSPVVSTCARTHQADVISKHIWESWRWLSLTAGTPVIADQDVQVTKVAPSSHVTTQATFEDIEALAYHHQPDLDASRAAWHAVPLEQHLRRRQFHLPAAVLQDLRPPTHPYQLTPVLSQRTPSNPAQYTPWTPTRALQRRKHVAKRMGFLMHVLEREQMERVRQARPLPDFRAGDVIEVRMMLPEAERKVTIYRGVCIARYHKGIRSTFKIYNVYPECGGVVQHIPLYMPDLLGLKVVGRIPASQERLFYLLDREVSDYTFQTGVSASS